MNSLWKLTSNNLSIKGTKLLPSIINQNSNSKMSYLVSDFVENYEIENGDVSDVDLQEPASYSNQIMPLHLWFFSLG